VKYEQELAWSELLLEDSIKVTSAAASIVEGRTTGGPVGALPGGVAAGGFAGGGATGSIGATGAGTGGATGGRVGGMQNQTVVAAQGPSGDLV